MLSKSAILITLLLSIAAAQNSITLNQLSQEFDFTTELSGVFDFSSDGYIVYIFEADEFDHAIKAYYKNTTDNKFYNMSGSFAEAGCTRRPHYTNDLSLYCINDHTQDLLKLNPKLPFSVIDTFHVGISIHYFDWLDKNT